MLRQLRKIEKELLRMSAAIEALTRKVEALEIADEAVVTNVTEVVSEIAALEAALQEARDQNSDPKVEAALGTLADRIGTVTGKLDNTVEALKGVQPPSV
jgi:predicted  nucleic acid-binding Zn-ribbon protein